MSRVRHPERTPWTAAAVLAAVAALTGCSDTTTTGTSSAPQAASTESAAVTDPAVTDNVDGQTEDVAPAPDPAVVLTYAGYEPSDNSVSAAAFFTGVVEEGGSCRLVVEQGGESVTATREAMASATTTDCGNLTVELPAGADGSWEVAVTYTSPTHSGTSRTETVAVQ